jgi:hypothetical protein
MCSAVAVLVAAGHVTPAVAGARLPSCVLIHDAANDTADPVPNDDSALDVLTTAISSTDSTITVKVGVRHVDQEATPGYAWQFDFAFGGNYFFFLGTSMPGGADYNAYKASAGPDSSRGATGIGAISGIVDARHATITFKADAALFRPYGLRRGTTLTGLYTSTWRANGDSTESVTGPVGHVSVAAGVVVDSASTGRTHTFAVTRCTS